MLCLLVSALILSVRCFFFFSSFSHFLCFLGVISLFTMTPEPSAEVLSSASGHKQTAMCLSRKYVCYVRFLQAGVTVLLAMS